MSDDPDAPRYPIYKDEDQRLVSFKGTKVTEAWSDDYKMAANKLAEAGFFYYGKGGLCRLAYHQQGNI